MLRAPACHLQLGIPVELDDEASHYLLRVHRIASGERVELFDPKTGEAARGVALPLAKKGAVLSVLLDELLPPEPPAMPVSVLVALGKGDKLDQALRDATTFGASRVVAVLTERVQGHKRQLDERHDRIVREAARQCGRNRVPEVIGPLSLPEAVAQAGGLRLAGLLHPEARPLLRRLEEWDLSVPLSLAIGPEGGFSADEERLLLEGGFGPVSLAPYVLRAEVAVTAALAAAALVWLAR